MAHLIVSVTTPDEIREHAALDPFGPRFSDELCAGADRYEVWGSEFAEPGDDYVEFRLYAGERELAKVRRAGY